MTDQAHTHQGPAGRSVTHNHAHGIYEHSHDSQLPAHAWAWQEPAARLEVTRYPAAPAEGWVWALRKNEFDGAPEYYGASAAHQATVTNHGPGWQATMPGTGIGGGLDQRSGYYRTPAAAKAWAMRYGKPGKRPR